MPVKIYGVLRSRASRNIWLLKEMGTPYEHIPVIQHGRLPVPKPRNAPMSTKSPAFLKINPNGQIPTMEDGKLVLNESLAINLYLAKKYGGKLGPANANEDGLMTMWAVWAMTECEPHTINILYHRMYKPVAERVAAIADAAALALDKPLSILEKHLKEKGGYMVGRRFTVADINLAEVLRYAQIESALFAKRPNLKAWIEKCQARKAYKAMVADRNAEPA
jgi:glutathione S-transferase